jgi:dTDP-4-amino-4,6-dideoxygalactose transaminase
MRSRIHSVADIATSPRSETPPELPAIPLTDIRLEPEDLEAVAETLRSGWLTMGPRTEAFEAAFAAHLGCRHAVAVSSCTAALHLAYLAAGVGPGDEVIVPSFTFAATASTVLNCGATPVFADIVGQRHPHLDPEDVVARITPRTKAIAVVHFAGYPAPIDRFAALCQERGVALIEDAAHTPSATYDGRKLGTWGLAGAFSLFSNKVLSTGEGGLLATDDDDVAALARRLRSQGMTSGTWSRHTGSTDTYDVTALGFNYRFDEPRSALAMSRFGRLEADIGRRRSLTKRYRDALAKIDGVIVPYDDESIEDSSCYVMPIFVDARRRDRFRVALREQHGVQTSVFYPAIHEFTAYRERRLGAALPRTELAARTEVTIPLFPHMTVQQQDRVIEAIDEEIAA